VLIVEDDVLIADLLQQQLLERDGYHVTGVARTVEEAIDLAKHNDPDYAVVDIKLANGDLGTDVAARLRETKSIGVIFSTGNDDHSLTSEQGEAVMSKPYRTRYVAWALKIVDELGRLGRTDLPFPRNFRLLSPALA
jgi:DNA-binding response OmpR family regulator